MGNIVERRDAMSAVQRTLGLIKPYWISHANPLVRVSMGDAYSQTLRAIDAAGLNVQRQLQLRLTRAQAEEFYHTHRGKFFYPRLVSYMSSGRVIALEITGDNAIARWREVIGATHRATALASAQNLRA